MANFAEMNSDNIVVRVLVTDNNDPAGDEGHSFLVDTFGGTWIQTSYNAKIRGNYAGIGYSYLKDHDIFMPPKCHPEATLDSVSANWDCTNEEHNPVSANWDGTNEEHNVNFN